MAVWNPNNLMVTQQGQLLLSKIQAGIGQATITKVLTGAGRVSPSQLYMQTAVSQPMQECIIAGKETYETGSILELQVSNNNLTTSYVINQIGVYASHPDMGEILYMIGQCDENTGDIMPLPSVTPVTMNYAFYLIHSKDANITINVNPAGLATIGDLAEVQATISNLQAYIGYTDNDIYGVEADFRNKTFTRLAGAVNKNAGADFDAIKAFGGRKRCIVADDGAVLAYYGEAGYSETGKTAIEIRKNSVTYPVGTAVQVMVEQPKFYYKVVPLGLEKIADYAEVDTITVTAGATADGNLTITLDGVAFTVSVLATDNTPELVAAKIRNATYAGWTTSGTGAVVKFTCNTTGVRTLATFNAASTGVTATVAQTVAGGKSIGYHMRKARYYVSDYPKSGFKIHPAFVRNDVVKDKIYLSAYEGSIYDVSANAYLLNDEQVADFTVSTGDKLSSIAYAKPASGLTQNLTRANTRKLANNRGAGWQLSDVLSALVTQMLFIIEYASFNTQDKIGLGIVNKTDDNSTNRSELTGATSNLGNASGMAAGTNGLTSVSYRGEENPWGNVWKWIDGLNIEAKGIHQAYWADSGFADDIKTAPYKNCGFTLAKANGYVSAFGYSEDCDFLFLPSEVIGASNLPVGDYFYQNHNYNGFLVALLGGSWSHGSNAGAFYWHVKNASSSRGRDVGGRLLYVP